jgi:hypothetical protein
MTAVKYHSANVDGFKIFYREADAAGTPKLLLLHGFPSASHMFRDLIPLLADRFRIVAPDLPGFGNSDIPGRGHSFDQIAATIDRFTEIVGFDRYAIYVFDYGAPTGFRATTCLLFNGSPDTFDASIHILPKLVNPEPENDPAQTAQLVISPNVIDSAESACVSMITVTIDFDVDLSRV